MKTKEEIMKVVCEANLTYIVEQAAGVMSLVEGKWDAITKFDELHPDRLDISRYDGIGLWQPTREELKDFLLCFGGEWEKEYENDTVTYKRGLLSAQGAPPPAHCRIEEYEVVVPEHKETKKRVVCDEPAAQEEPELAAEGTENDKN
jgi:hypothetical protein